MEAVEIPISSEGPYFSQENHVFGLTYNLEFEWIERGQFWVMHIYDEAEQPIALGLRLMVNWPLFIHYKEESKVEFFLIAQMPNSQLNLATLHRDFLLVAHESV